MDRLSGQSAVTKHITLVLPSHTYFVKSILLLSLQSGPCCRDPFCFLSLLRNYMADSRFVSRG